MLGEFAGLKTPAQQSFHFEAMPPRPPQKRPHESKSTSLVAYRDVLPRLGSQKRRALDCIVAAGRNGRTRYEAHVAGGIPYCSISSPVKSLIDDGLIVETTTTRPTPNGKPAHVLVAAEFAQGASP